MLFLSVTHHRRLVRREVPNAVLARVRRACSLAPPVYALSLALALWNAVAGLLVCASLWVVWSRLCYRALRDPERASGSRRRLTGLAPDRRRRRSDRLLHFNR